MSEIIQRVAEAIAAAPEFTSRQNKMAPDKNRWEVFQLGDDEVPTISSFQTYGEAAGEAIHLTEQGRARAAIAAMREPTEVMRTAATSLKVDFSTGHICDVGRLYSDGADAVFGAMIDAALKDGE